MLGRVDLYNRNNMNFTGNESPAGYTADKFINDVGKVVKAEEKGDIFSRTMWSPTASNLVAGIVIGYEIGNLHSLHKAKKAGDAEKLKLLKTAHPKQLLWLTGISAAIVAGLEYLFSRNSEAKYEKFKEDFEKINTSTSAKLADRVFTSSVKGAYCSPISGEITVNKSMMYDPYMRFKSKKMIKHELVHAKQYETIVRSKNGIKKLNYACVKNIAKNLDNPQARREIEQIYNDICADKIGKYENFPLQISGATVDLKNYITALHIILNDKNANINDIPMVIDEKHYKKVINKKGKLTPEEEIMADKYYQAQIDYPKLTVWNMLNPFSDYYNNLLEREAYKENPGFYGFIRKVFGKD